MHVAAVLIFDGGPLVRAGGGVDIERIRAHLTSVLRHMPRYRQKLGYVPLLNHPVWIDDDRFNIEYHVRHTCLPRPGGADLLKRFAGWVMSQKLDRTKPLWEFWVVEGLQGGRFAVIIKVHHCVADGISGVDLLLHVLRFTEDAEIDAYDPAPARPLPTPMELVVGELGHRLQAPRTLLQAVRRVRELLPPALGSQWRSLARVGESFATGLVPSSSRMPLNVETGPHRRFEWASCDLTAVKALKNRTLGTVNDVVLATVCGAVRRFFRLRGVEGDAGVLRVLIPVSTRTPEECGALGNHVASMLATLPVGEEDPAVRLDRVIETTRQLKRSGQAGIVQLVEEAIDRVAPRLFAALIDLTTRAVTYDLVVTNIPGPQAQAFMLGAPLRDIYPMVPLFRRQALGIALVSYNGRLYWGLNGDFDALPDLERVRRALQKSFRELLDAVGVIGDAGSTLDRTPFEPSGDASGAGRVPAATTDAEEATGGGSGWAAGRTRALSPGPDAAA